MSEYKDPYAGLSQSDRIKLMEAYGNRSVKQAELLDKYPQLDSLLTKVDKTGDRYEIIKKAEELVGQLEEHKKSNPKLAWHIKEARNGSELIIETNIQTGTNKTLKLAVGRTVGFEEGLPAINSEGKPLFRHKQNIQANPNERLHYNGTDIQVRHSEYSGDKDSLSKNLKSYVDGKKPELQLPDTPHKEPKMPTAAKTWAQLPEGSSRVAPAGAGETLKVVSGASKVIAKAATPLAVVVDVAETGAKLVAKDGHGAAEAAGSGAGALAAAGATAKSLAHGAQKLGEAALSDPRAGKIKVLGKVVVMLGTAVAGVIGSIGGGDAADKVAGDKLHEALNPPTNKAEVPPKTEKKDVAVSLNDNDKAKVTKLVSKMNERGIKMSDTNKTPQAQQISSKPQEVAHAGGRS